MIDKLNNFTEAINTNGELISWIGHKTTFGNGYDIVLHNEDYTLGKVLEFLLYTNYYEGSKILDFCGFRKPHPHIPVSIIRVSFIPSFKPGDDSRNSRNSASNEKESQELYKVHISGMIANVCRQAVDIYENIQRVF